MLAMKLVKQHLFSTDVRAARGAGNHPAVHGQHSIQRPSVSPEPEVHQNRAEPGLRCQPEGPAEPDDPQREFRRESAAFEAGENGIGRRLEPEQFLGGQEQQRGSCRFESEFGWKKKDERQQNGCKGKNR